MCGVKWIYIKQEWMFLLGRDKSVVDASSLDFDNTFPAVEKM